MNKKMRKITSLRCGALRRNDKGRRNLEFRMKNLEFRSKKSEKNSKE